MSTGEYTPLLRSGSSRSNVAQHHIPIHAHYFDITDIESWPIAGLLVMLDGQGQPVRAELHLYDELQPNVQESAIRQVRLVLQEQYLGGAPVPVRILETFQVREEMVVGLPPLGARSARVPTIPSMRKMPKMPIVPQQWRQFGVIGGAILGVLLVVWLVASLMGRNSDGASSDLAVATSDVASQVQSQAGADSASSQSENTSDAQVEPATVAEPSSVGLPVSRNARGDLRIGMRVQPVPGLRVALRSEPGVDTGSTIGELAEGDTAIIISGPEYRQGDSDTIVWWFVELPNSVTAWTAANTSEQTLLMPAP